LSLNQALSDWSALLGHDQIVEQANLPPKFRSDTSGHCATIRAVIRVKDPDHLPQIMRIAGRHRVKIHPVSTGNNWGYGSAIPVNDDTCILDLSGLCKIIDFDQELGVVTLEPGVTQGMLEAFLDEHKLAFMTPVTGAGPDCSLVGNALERGYGITPVADHYAAVTDMEVVLADGSVHRSSLADLGCTRIARLHKWDLGPHLAGMFSQSGLGVVRSMSIALAPRPECIKSCIFALTDISAVGRYVPLFRQAIRQLGGTLGGLNIMNSHRVIAMLGQHPNDKETGFEVLTPAQLHELERQHMIAPWTGFASLYGSRRVVSAAQRELRSILGGRVSRLVFVDETRARQIALIARILPGRLGLNAARSAKTLRSALGLLRGRPNETTLPLAYWLDHRKIPPAGQALDPARDACGLIWYSPLVPMSAGCVESTIDMVYEVTKRHQIEPLITLTSLNDRLFDCTVPLLFRSDEPGRLEAARRCYFELVQSGKKIGVYPYRLAAFSMGLVRPSDRQGANLHERLRAHLDPQDILAPGRYV